MAVRFCFHMDKYSRMRSTIKIWDDKFIAGFGLVKFQLKNPTHPNPRFEVPAPSPTALLSPDTKCPAWVPGMHIEVYKYIYRMTSLKGMSVIQCSFVVLSSLQFMLHWCFELAVALNVFSPTLHGSKIRLLLHSRTADVFSDRGPTWIYLRSQLRSKENKDSFVEVAIRTPKKCDRYHTFYAANSKKTVYIWTHLDTNWYACKIPKGFPQTQS